MQLSWKEADHPNDGSEKPGVGQGAPGRAVCSVLLREVVLQIISDLSLDSSVVRKIAKKCGGSPAIGATLQVTTSTCEVLDVFVKLEPVQFY